MESEEMGHRKIGWARLGLTEHGERRRLRKDGARFISNSAKISKCYTCVSNIKSDADGITSETRITSATHHHYVKQRRNTRQHDASSSYIHIPIPTFISTRCRHHTLGPRNL
jgi:hypothetical protein